MMTITMAMIAILAMSTLDKAVVSLGCKECTGLGQAVSQEVDLVVGDVGMVEARRRRRKQ